MTWRMTLRLLRVQNMGSARGALETMAAFEQRLADAARFLGLGDTKSAQLSLEAAEGHYCALADAAGVISARHPYDEGIFYGGGALERDWDASGLEQALPKVRTRYESLLDVGFGRSLHLVGLDLVGLLVLLQRSHLVDQFVE